MTNEQSARGLEDAFNGCVDQILAGQPWDTALSPDEREELLPYAEVAEQLANAARHDQHHGGEPIYTRIWGRVASALHLPGHAATRFQPLHWPVSTAVVLPQ